MSTNSIVSFLPISTFPHSWWRLTQGCFILTINLLVQQDSVNKCCGDQQHQRKGRPEILITINQRSVSHSSRSQNNMVLTEVTTLSNLTGNFVQPIHHPHNPSHHHHHLSFNPTTLTKHHELAGEDEIVQV